MKLLTAGVVLAVLLGGVALYISAQEKPLGRSIVTYPSDVYSETNFSCARIYQLGATTLGSSTFYLVASTTGGTISSTLPVFATSTRPTICR